MGFPWPPWGMLVSCLIPPLPQKVTNSFLLIKRMASFLLSLLHLMLTSVTFQQLWTLVPSPLLLLSKLVVTFYRDVTKKRDLLLPEDVRKTVPKRRHLGVKSTSPYRRTNARFWIRLCERAVAIETTSLLIQTWYPLWMALLRQSTPPGQSEQRIQLRCAVYTLT